MATVQTGYVAGSQVALTKGVTNTATPPALAVALTDGEGNLLGSGGDEPSTFLTYVSAAQAVSNAGQSFTTSTVQSLAVDITLTSFTGGTAPAVTYFVDRFGADGVWYRTWTSAALAAAAAVSVAVGAVSAVAATATLEPVQGVPATLTNLARFGWSSTGAPTAITFSASVIGR